MTTSFDEENIIYNIKQRLEREKDSISDTVFQKYTWEEINKALESINNNQFQIYYGKFKIEGISEKGKGIHIRYTPKNDSRTSQGTIDKYTPRIKQIIEEEIVLSSTSVKQFLFSEEEKKRWGKVLTFGTEARIYENPDNSYELFKVIDYKQQTTSIFAFFKRLEGYNELFKETQYQLIGFIEEHNMLKPVISQDFVPGKTLAFLENADIHFNNFLKQYQELGFLIDKESESISLNGYTAHDLNFDNIIWGENKDYYVIDSLVIPDKSKINEGFKI